MNPAGQQPLPKAEQENWALTLSSGLSPSPSVLWYCLFSNADALAKELQLTLLIMVQPPLASFLFASFDSVLVFLDSVQLLVDY